MSRILVTGASGFMGRAVTAALARNGYAVRAAVRQAPRLPFGAGVEVLQHPDLSETFDWEPLLQGVDGITHLAGIAHSGTGIAPELYDRVNRQATARLATAAARCGVRQFVFVSSIRAQNGPAAGHVLTERDAAMPTDDYGRSKLAAEAALREAGVPFTVLRPVVVYGPGVKGNVALLLRAAASRWPLPVASFANRRSLLGIDNFIAAVRFVLATSAALGETYIVADPGAPPSLAEVMAILRRAQGRRPLLLPLPTPLVAMALRLTRHGDLWERIGGSLRADPARLVAAGWQPVHDTPSGLLVLARSEAQGSAPTPGATSARRR